MLSQEESQEIRKWIKQRRKKYPKRKRQNATSEGLPSNSETSKLQAKLRKKLGIINSDVKDITIKQKSCKFIEKMFNSKLKPRIKQQKVIKKRTKIFNNKDRQHQDENEDQCSIQNPKQQPLAVQQDQALKHMINELKQKKIRQQQDILKAIQGRVGRSNIGQNFLLNLCMQDVLKQYSYMIQSIRYIIRHDYFNEKPQQKKEQMKEIEKDSTYSRITSDIQQGQIRQ